MTSRSTLISLLSVALAACSNSTSTNSTPDAIRTDKFGSLNGAKIEVLAEGGFAAFAIRHSVNHDDRAYVYTRRQLCDKNCGAPMDSVAGTLTPAAADSLFNIVLAQDPIALKDNYGTTTGGADMYNYTVRVTAEGQSKTIKFDDGTMPEPMRKILDAVTGIVSAARR